MSHNRMMWDQRVAGHHEVWYVTCNHPPSRTGFWIRYALAAPLQRRGDAYCELWFAFFDAAHPERNLALNRRLPRSAFTVEQSAARVKIGESELGPGRLTGALAGNHHAARWDLTFQPSSFTHFHLPASVYRSRLADTAVLSPNLMIQLDGCIEVDGQTFALTRAPGCQTHLWGRKLAHAWAWGHCSAFAEERDACLELLSVRLRRFGVVSPALTFFSLYLGDEIYHFNRFTTLLRTRGRWGTGHCSFSGSNAQVRIAGELRCRAEDLVQAAYTDPDGELSFCHNTEVADASLTVWKRPAPGASFRRWRRLTSHAMAHFEYASRTPDIRVPRCHITVA